MSGAKTGVAKRISDEEPHAVFYGHSLNLAARDTKQSSIMNNALDTTHEVTKFSPNMMVSFVD